MTNQKDPTREFREEKQSPLIYISGGLWEDKDPTPTGDKQLCAYQGQLRAKHRRQKGYYKLPKNLFGSGRPIKGNRRRK